MEVVSMEGWRKYGSIATAVLAVVVSVLLAGWMARNNTAHLQARVLRAESELAQATEKLNTAASQVEVNRGHLEQLIRDQRLRNDKDSELRTIRESELLDMRSELKMLRQAVFTMPAASRNRRR
jgi:replicative DNA helicase